MVKDATSGRRRRGRPPRRRGGLGRPTGVDPESPGSDHANDDYEDMPEPAGDASDFEEQAVEEEQDEVPRIRIRRRGRPPKRSMTPNEEEDFGSTIVDAKRRKEEEETSDQQQSGEVESETDEAGETKVDKKGNLQGGKFYVFMSKRRGGT